MFLFDPNACASSRINHDCGRNQYGRTGPGTFEIVECGFGNDYPRAYSHVRERRKKTPGAS